MNAERRRSRDIVAIVVDEHRLLRLQPESVEREATHRAISHAELTVVPHGSHGRRVTLKGQPAVPLFDDTMDWWFDGDEHGTGDHPGFYEPEWYGVDVPKTGTTVRVVSVNPKSKVMTVKVGTSN